MLEERYYAIPTFSYEWWVNTSVTVIFMFAIYLIAKSFKDKKALYYFNFILGAVLLIRFIGVQLYHCYIGIWDIQWSLPLQLCSFSSVISGLLPILQNFNINKKIKQFLFETLFYFSLGAIYAIITPVYTAGSQGLIYYEYYVSHGGIIFTAIYFIFVLDYRLTKKSWLKIFLYSQILLIIIHIINLFIGGQANYFYTVEPPIADNPLVMGGFPKHIIMLDIFALIHFYIFYILISRIIKK